MVPQLYICFTFLVQSKNKLGTIEKGSQPNWVYDILGSPVFWVSKAEEINRMVEIGFITWKSDLENLRSSEKSTDLNHAMPPSTLLVSFFLASLAIENLLKAALVREHPQCIQNGKMHGDIINSHDLVKISKAAEVCLSDDENEFCKLATECILQFGRYPIAKNASELITNFSITEFLFEVYEELFQRIIKDVRFRPFKKMESDQ
jgi:hypothetical protein